MLGTKSVFAVPYKHITRGHRLHLSFMTVAEMRYGALRGGWGTRSRDVLEIYLEEFLVHHSSDQLCSIWADVRSLSIRKGREIQAPDAWIAATAIHLSLPLVTNNPKDYRHLDHLQLITALP